MLDVLVIGSGPAGYVAAERAGELGLSAMLVEREEHLGGVCLNSGCIPTKAMLHCAHLYDHARHGAAYGVTAEGLAFDYGVVKARTEGIQDKLRKGIGALMKLHKVEVVRGEARLTAPDTVEVNGETTRARNILICTGSRPFLPPIPGLADNPKVATHVELLAAEAMPDRLCIIGGGVIGVEFAGLYSAVGKEVTVIEMLPGLCGPTDKELAKTVQKALEARGVNIHLQAAVREVDGATVAFDDRKGERQSVEADLVLCATGRSVNVEGLGLEALGVEFDRRGIRVDERARTNVPGLYAAGDVTGRWQLAHFASRQAVVAIEHMAGHDAVCREDAVPTVVYSDPEIASVGLTEAVCKERGIACTVEKFNLGNNGRFLAETDGDRGVCKVVLGAGHGEILGIHIVAPHASEMIAAGAVLIETELRGRDLAEIIFPHPTISEAIHDAVAH